MRYFGIFWLLIGIYFIVFHPAIIYYNTNSNLFLEGRNPTWAIIYLIISILGWLIVFGFAGKKIYNATFELQSGAKKILANGKSILAEILSSEILDQSNPNQINKKLVVRFNNFSGTPIKFPIYITDTNPQLIRYEKGNSIPIKVDEKVKYAPYVLPDGSTPAVKNRLFFLLSAIWVIAALLLITYFIYAYTTESMGYGWRFLSLDHPLLLSMFIAIFFGFLYLNVVGRILSSTFSTGSDKNMKLLFYGKTAQAQILEVAQTGTYINENPQVKYSLQFHDDKNRLQKNSLKKVIMMIDLPYARQEQKRIYFLPEDSSVIAFEEDVIIE